MIPCKVTAFRSLGPSTWTLPVSQSLLPSNTLGLFQAISVRSSRSLPSQLQTRKISSTPHPPCGPAKPPLLLPISQSPALSHLFDRGMQGHRPAPERRIPRLSPVDTVGLGRGCLSLPREGRRRMRGRGGWRLVRERRTLCRTKGELSLSCVPVSHPRSSAISGRRLSPDQVTSTVPRVRTKW